MQCRKIEVGTEEYEAAVRLRNDILRRHLGMQLGDADFERDRRWHHIGCFEGELLVAFLGLEEHDVKTLRMRHVAVLEKKQRRGYGTAIVKFSEEFAKSQGAHLMFLHARDTAVGFYEKRGYVREGDFFLEVSLPHITMTKSLIA